MKWFNLIAGAAAVSLLAIGSGVAAAAPATTGIRGDTDGNGTLTAVEVREERKIFLLSLDANKDGKVSAEEFINGLKKEFDARDTNKDGVLSADEFVVYWCGKTADPKASKAKAAKVSQLKGHMMKHIDKNMDGMVTQDECVIFWSTRFSAADTNKDGKVSKAEFEAVLKQAAKRMDANKDGFLAVEEYSLSWAGDSKTLKKVKDAATK